MKWKTEDDIANSIMGIICQSPGILVSKIGTLLNEGESDKTLIVQQSVISRLVNSLVDAGKVRTDFLSGQVFRACYPSDYPVVLTIGEKPKSSSSILVGGLEATLKEAEEGY